MARHSKRNAERRGARQWFRRVAASVVIAAATVSCNIASTGASAASNSITEFIRRPGDQVLMVPNGIYTGGVVTAPHAASDGPYQGWLVLVAERPRDVVIDLSQSPLVLDEGTSRVLFVGFKFINGTISVRGDDIGFWYTEHTFPIEEWGAHYRAAGATADALKQMVNPLPKAIWIGDYTSRTVRRTKIFGADIHDVGDDGVFVDHSSGAVIQGSRIWNIDRKSLDPGYNPWKSEATDLFHNDAVQIPGSVTDYTMADSYVGSTMNVGGDNASSTNLEWRNLWIAGSNGVGFLFGVQGANRASGTMRDIRAWGNGVEHADDPGWDQLRVDMNESHDAAWPASLHDRRLTVATDGTILNATPPSGVTMVGRHMVDPSQAIDNPENPALVWRAAHPYDSWATALTAGATKSPAPAKPARPTAKKVLTPQLPKPSATTAQPLTDPRRTTTVPAVTTTTTPTTVATPPATSRAGAVAAGRRHGATNKNALATASGIAVVGVSVLILLGGVRRRCARNRYSVSRIGQIVDHEVGGDEQDEQNTA